MRNKKHLKNIFINEYFLIKSIKTVFILVLILTCVAFPALFISIYRIKPDAFYKDVIESSQSFFPFFSSLLTIFILKNYIEQYNCEIYFLDSKVKIRESLLILFLYYLALLIPFGICIIFERNMIFEYLRVLCQCFLFSSIAYMMMFITMSVSFTIIPIFMYLMFSIYKSRGESPSVLIFFSEELMNKTNIISAVMPALIAGTIFYAVGVVINIYRSKRYNPLI